MPNFAASRPVQAVAAAVIATTIGLSLLWGVVTLFQSRGVPFEQLAAAERACADKAYASDREACVKRWIADSRMTSVAVR